MSSVTAVAGMLSISAIAVAAGLVSLSVLLIHLGVQTLYSPIRLHDFLIFPIHDPSAVCALVPA
jgi:hypothetical protein